MATVESVHEAPRWEGVRATPSSKSRVLTWRFGISTLVLMMWLIPMKEYSLPAKVPFKLEPYRLCVIILLGILLVAILIGRATITSAGHGRPLLMLALAVLVAQLANWSTIQASTNSSQSIKALSYFFSVLVVYLLVASAVQTREDIEAIIRVLVAGATLVAIAALYESKSKYNLFDHLGKWIPILHFTGNDNTNIRYGAVRVRASAQDPISLGCVLGMAMPLALYSWRKASTRVRGNLWLAAAAILAMGAVATISRTVVLMFGVMLLVGLAIRGRALRKRWPIAIVLLVAVHFGAPGSLGKLYKALNPKQGLVQQLQSRAGQQGSGRLADLGPGLTYWAKAPVFGHGLATGSTDNTTGRIGRAIDSSGAAVIFDDQYLGALVGLGAVGFIGIFWFIWGAVVKLGKSARRLGERADLLAACAISASGFGAGMATFDAFSFVQSTFMFFVIVALGLKARKLLLEDPHQGAVPFVPSIPRFVPRVAAAHSVFAPVLPLAGAAAVAAPAPAEPVSVPEPAFQEEGELAPAGVTMRTDLDSAPSAMARGAAVNLVGALGANALGSITSIIVAHLVLPSAIGLASIGATMANLILIPAVLGLDTGVIRFIALAVAAGDERRARAAFQVTLAIATVTSCVLAGLVWHEAGWLAAHYFHKPESASILRISAVSIPALALGRLATAAIQGFGLMTYGAWLGVIRRVANLLVVLPLIALGFGARGIAEAAVVAAWAVCLASFAYALRAHPHAFVPAVRAWPTFSLLNFSIPQLFTATLFFAVVWTDTLLLARYEPPHTVGVYAIVGQLLIPATLVATAVGQMFAPRIAVQDARGDRVALAGLLKRVTHWNTAVSLPVFTLLVVAPSSMLSIFGDRYRAGALALAILSVGELINTAAGPLGQVLNMTGRQYLSATNNGVVAGLNVAGCLYLIPRYGMTGAAISTTGALTLVNLVKILEVKLIFGIQPFRGDSPRAFIAAASAAGAALLATLPVPWPDPKIEAIAAALIVFVVYAVVLRLLGLDEEDKELFMVARRRVARGLRKRRVQE